MTATFLDCRACGKENPAANSFCSGCGNRLGAPSASSVELPRDSGQPQYTPAVVAPWWSAGPFASRGTRLDHDHLIHEGAAGRERQFLHWVREALRPFRADEESLYGTAREIERRTYVTATRGNATVAIFAVPTGTDLYVSWALFSQRHLDVRRVIGLVLVAMVFGLPAGIGLNLFASTQWSWGSYLTSGVIPWLVVLTVLVGWAGFTFRRDPLGYVRAPLSEFQLDDAHSLGEAAKRAVRSWQP